MKRALFFRLRIPSGADTRKAGGYGNFSYENDSELYVIRAGEKRYEIPDTVVLGS